MTREEIGELIAALPEGLDADEFIYKLVNWAVDREREACAQIAFNAKTYLEAAKAIRARGEHERADTRTR